MMREHFPDRSQQDGVIVQYQNRKRLYGNPVLVVAVHTFLCHRQGQVDSKTAAYTFPACQLYPAFQQLDQAFDY